MRTIKSLFILAILISAVFCINNINITCDVPYNEKEIIEKNNDILLNSNNITNLIEEMVNKKKSCITYVWLNGTISKEELEKNLKLNVSLFDWDFGNGKTDRISNSLIVIETDGSEVRIYTYGILYKGLKFIRNLEFGGYTEYVLIRDHYDNEKTLNNLIKAAKNIANITKKSIVIKNVTLVGNYENNDKKINNSVLDISIYPNGQVIYEKIKDLDIKGVDYVLYGLSKDFVYINDARLNRTLKDIEKIMFGNDLDNIEYISKKELTYGSNYAIFGLNEIKLKDGKRLECNADNTELKIEYVKDYNLYVICGNLRFLDVVFKNMSKFNVETKDFYWNGKEGLTIIIKPKREIVEVIYNKSQIRNIFDLEGKYVYYDVLKKYIDEVENGKKGNVINKTVDFYLIDPTGNVWVATLDIKNLKKDEYSLIMPKTIDIKNVKYYPIWLNLFKKVFKIDKETNDKNIIKIVDIVWNKKDKKIHVKIITSGYNIDQLKKCYYLGRFDLCKDVGIEKLDNLTLKIKNNKNKTIEELLKENNLVGVLIVYKYTREKTNETSRIRDPEEILYGWTGGKTLEDVLKDLSNSNGSVEYDNCSEYWRGKDGYFVKYKCKFYVFNKNKVKSAFYDGKYKILYDNKVIAEDKDSKIDPLYVTIVNNKTTKQEKTKPLELDQKLKAEGFVGYILYGNECKNKFENIFKNKEISEGIYKSENCVMIVFKPEENINKHVYDVSNIVKNVVGLDGKYYLVVDTEEFKTKNVGPQFVLFGNKSEFEISERDNISKLYGWLGLSNGYYDAPFQRQSLDELIKQMKDRLENANVTKGEEFWRDNKNKQIIILTSYLIKYDGKEGMHVENKPEYKYKAPFWRMIDSLLSIINIKFNFG